jgi:uncharacterized membrane protein YeiH
VFALTGALVAGRRRLDLLAFAMLATVTGIGGGTLRDVFLARPVSWIQEPRDLAICLAVAVGVFVLGRIRPAALARLEKAGLLAVADAAGLALFCVIGALIARDAGAHWLVALVLGAITASFGGIIRDVLVHEPSLILQTEIYITAAALGAALTLLVLALDGGRSLAMIGGIVGAFSLRLGAIRFGWALPTSPRS